MHRREAVHNDHTHERQQTMTNTLTPCKKQTNGIYLIFRNGQKYHITNDKNACCGFKWTADPTDKSEPTFWAETKRDLLSDMRLS